VLCCQILIQLLSLLTSSGIIATPAGHTLVSGKGQVVAQEEHDFGLAKAHIISVEKRAAGIVLRKNIHSRHAANKCWQNSLNRKDL